MAATPGLPDSAKKYNYATTPTVPRIPALPISAADALPFMAELQGIDVNTDSRFVGWQVMYG